MAHLFETGFFVGTPAWHELGTVLDNAPSVADAIKLAGCDWSVELRRLHLADGRPVNANAIVRTTDDSILADHVGMRYQPLQNIDAFNWFEPFVSSGEAKLETAGSLDDGKKVWVLAELNRKPTEIVPGDAVRKFLLLSNAHDGCHAVRCGFTPIRVVCNNTLTAAHGASGSSLLRIKHTASTKKTLDEIRDVVNAADATFEATADQYRALARRQISRTDLTKYVKTVFDMPAEDGKMSTRTTNILNSILERYEANNAVISQLLAGHAQQQEERKANDANLLNQIIGNFEAGRGSENVNGRWSYWAAYNAVTEYLSHDRGATPEKRLDSLWFGSSQGINEKALDVATKMASVV